MAHYYEYTKGYIAEDVFKKAAKAIGLRTNSKVIDRMIYNTVHVKDYHTKNEKAELFAYSFEYGMLGKSPTKLSEAVYKIIIEEA